MTTYDPEAERPHRLDWAEAFANAFLDLTEGQEDKLSLLDWAYELYPSRGAEDPSTVASDEFETGRD